MSVVYCATDDVWGGPEASYYDGTSVIYADRVEEGVYMTPTPGVTVSFWFKLENTDGVAVGFFSFSSTRFEVTKLTSNVFRFIVWEPDPVGGGTGTTMVTADSTETTLQGTGWHHMLLSVDGPTQELTAFLDDSELTLSETWFSNGNIALDRREIFIGADNQFGSPRDELEGCMSSFWLQDVYTDLSVVNNRRLFTDASGNAIDLGTTGQNPTGSAAKVFLQDSGTNFGINSGTTGNFTKFAGTPLTVCVDAPPYV